MMGYMDSGFKSSLPSTTDCLSNRVNAYKRQISEWMTRGKTILPSKDPQRQQIYKVTGKDNPQQDESNLGSKNVPYF